MLATSWVTEQYDRYVLGNTVLAMPEDAGVVRVDEDRPGAGSRSPLDGNGRYCALDPYAGRPAGARRGLPQRRGQRRAAAMP